MVRLLSASLPLYVVNEYPKSGGSWFGEMLGEGLGLPFPRNRAPSIGSCIMHGHYLYRAGLRNVVVVWRDGRDVLTSFYYHSYFRNDRDNGALVNQMRKRLPFDDYRDIERNLPTFIERALTNPIRPRFTWQRFVSQWRGCDKAMSVRYERLLEDAESELARVLRELGQPVPEEGRLREIVESHSFKRKSGRFSGEESNSSFLRKGIAGDWKNCFSREAREVFDFYAGNELISLGYERDHKWVERDR